MSGTSKTLTWWIAQKCKKEGQISTLSSHSKKGDQIPSMRSILPFVGYEDFTVLFWLHFLAILNVSPQQCVIWSSFVCYSVFPMSSPGRKSQCSIPLAGWHHADVSHCLWLPPRVVCGSFVLELSVAPLSLIWAARRFCFIVSGTG